MFAPPFNALDPRCPSRFVLSRIGDRWTALIVSLLEERPYRFGELRRTVEGIAQKMLTQTLRALEKDGLVRERCSLLDRSRSTTRSPTSGELWSPLWRLSCDGPRSTPLKFSTRMRSRHKAHRRFPCGRPIRAESKLDRALVSI
jgi:hypothetical protein